MFEFISSLFGSQRKTNVKKFADLVTEIKKISSVYECGLAMKAVIKFRESLSGDDELIPYIDNLVEFIIDTRSHAKDGYHKSTKTEWKTSQKFPDINDYFRFKIK